MQSSSIVLAVLSLLSTVAGSVADHKCTANFGFCQYTSNRCSGSYISNLCNGPYNRLCCVPAFRDEQCHSRQGKCQSTSVRCHDGSYVQGLCGGPANRRCCVPASLVMIVLESCGTEQRRLACELFHSENVRAAQSHSANVKDNAFAYNNLKDMCDGKKASRSSYKSTCRCYAPGGSTCLSVNLLRYLVKLKNGGIVNIDELAGGCHSCTSRHYSGLAVDLHRDRRTPDYIRKCQEMEGEVRAERKFIHCQFRDGIHPSWKREI